MKQYPSMTPAVCGLFAHTCKTHWHVCFLGMHLMRMDTPCLFFSVRVRKGKPQTDALLVKGDITEQQLIILMCLSCFGEPKSRGADSSPRHI